MNTHTINKEIRDHKYVVSLFPAMRAYQIARKLIDVFTSADPVAKLCDIDKDGELMLELLSHTIRDESVINKATFDNIFTGNLMELVDALMFVFEVNFKDFLEAKNIGNLKGKAKTLLK